MESAFACAEEDHKVSTVALEKELEQTRSALAELRAQLEGETAKYAAALENMEEVTNDCKTQAEKVVALEEERTLLKCDLEEVSGPSFNHSENEVKLCCCLLQETITTIRERSRITHTSLQIPGCY